MKDGDEAPGVANSVENHDKKTRAPGGGEQLPVLEIGHARTAVRLELLTQGPDHLLRVTGGCAHIGAVAVCDVGPGRKHVHAADTTVEMPGHREGPLAAEAAETLAAATGRVCTAVVGIHQDNATPAEIKRIVANVREGLRRLAASLGGHGEQEQ